MGDVKFTLKALRVNKKLNQEDVADLLGVSLKTYQNYEVDQDNAKWKHIKKLANYYGISTDLIY